MSGADILKCIAGIGLALIFVSLLRDMGIPSGGHSERWLIAHGKSDNFEVTPIRDIDAVTEAHRGEGDR